MPYCGGNVAVIPLALRYVGKRYGVVFVVHLKCGDYHFYKSLSCDACGRSKFRAAHSLNNAVLRELFYVFLCPVVAVQVGELLYCVNVLGCLARSCRESYSTCRRAAGCFPARTLAGTGTRTGAAVVASVYALIKRRLYVAFVCD